MSRTTDLPRTAVPPGVATFYPDLAARKRHVEARALSTLAGWGYLDVVPPLFEYLDVLAQGLAPEMVERGYKIEDRQDGRLMVLRPDVTAQVARMAAARREDPAVPHRYAYAVGVFSHAEAHRGRPREVFQVGAELLGPGGREADAEVLSLLATTLRELGLEDFTVALGHAGYFQAVLDDLGLAEGPRAALLDAMCRRDAPAVGRLLAAAGADPARCEQVARIPFLLGGREVFEAARALTAVPAAHAALDHLEAVSAALEAAGLGRHLRVDLGETRDLAYYTGVVFEVLVPELGFELGGGGRYDDLVGRFGHPMHAVGFALDVERVIEALVRAGVPLPAPALDWVVTGPPADAHRAAAALRTRGLKVAVALPDEAPDVPRLRVEGDRLAVVTPQGPRPTDPDALAEEARRRGAR
jgi:ATP phosphoribosyltransferase regulatory subunit